MREGAQEVATRGLDGARWPPGPPLQQNHDGVNVSDVRSASFERVGVPVVAFLERGRSEREWDDWQARLVETNRPPR
jgi:hypothetical protein